MVENIYLFFDGLKIILFYFFNKEEFRIFFLKGVIIVVGGVNLGINKEMFNLLYGK